MSNQQSMISSKGFWWTYITLCVWIVCFPLPSSLVEASLVTAERRALQDIQLVLQLNSSAVGWNATADPCTWPGITCDVKGNHVLKIKLELFADSSPMRGAVPASLANLSSLESIDLANNFLGGNIPSELGTLSRLQYLSVGNNNITGEIPPELGRLKSLLTLYLDVNLLEGGIPPTFANLTSLQQLHLSTNNLSGLIPSELGSLTLLQELHLDDNGFSGTIPSTFRNLTNLTSLMLDNNNLGGGLAILEAMPALTELYLARNNFSGQIPQFGTNNPNLGTLSLCFNNLSGTIPVSLGNLSKLKVLSLSHNSLSGVIPDSIQGANLSNLNILDVSHNSLSGSLNFTKSSWNTTNLESDFSFNCFGSGANDLASSLRKGNNTLFNSCSQSSTGHNSQFAINVGGYSSVTNNDRVTFQPDLSFDTCTGLMVNPSNTWALQVLSDKTEYPSTIAGTGTAISNVSADEMEIYQSMRWAPVYMAYYGINMRSGLYNVSLYFAEIVFTLPGYRVFDVMVQGKIVRSKLDVVKEVGSNVAFREVVQVDVTDGLLKIEFLYVGLNRWLQTYGLSANQTGPMVSGISVQLVHPRKTKWKYIGATLGAVAVLAALSLLVLYIWKRNCHKGSEFGGVQADGIFSDDFNRSAFYSYKELQDATDHFNDANIIGRGGFGTVYRGVLRDKSVVAIKQLTQKCHKSKVSFKREMTILSSVQHRNLLMLRGCCIDTEFPLLVCEYMPNGSLSDLLHRNEGHVLEWESRRNIAIGTACGLAYLHHELKHRIIHCDMKPANILLDANNNPRIADFGLSRLVCDDMVSHISTTNIQGTVGYLAPEYVSRSQISEKIDVFSFGVVLFELLSGRKVLDFSLPSEQIVMLNWANQVGDEPDDLLKLVDPKLLGEMVEKEALEMAKVARLCTQDSASLRPTMREVWQMLSGSANIPAKLPSVKYYSFRSASSTLASCIGSMESQEPDTLELSLTQLPDQPFRFSRPSTSRRRSRDDGPPMRRVRPRLNPERRQRELTRSLIIMLEVEASDPDGNEIMFEGSFENQNTQITAWSQVQGVGQYRWLPGPINHLSQERRAEYLASTIRRILDFLQL